MVSRLVWAMEVDKVLLLLLVGRSETRNASAFDSAGGQPFDQVFLEVEDDDDDG